VPCTGAEPGLAWEVGGAVQLYASGKQGSAAEYRRQGVRHSGAQEARGVLRGGG